MKTLLTGGSGFLGKYLYTSLSQKGEVLKLGRDHNSEIKCDLAFEEPKLNFPFDMIVHSAGLAHRIPKTKSEIQQFYSVNFTGTVNLCHALEMGEKLPNTFIFISTIAVYGKDEGMDISEHAPLLGNSPYSLSKIKAEEFLINWATQLGVNLVILRLPLIAGPNPPGNLGKMIKAIKFGYYLRIGKGNARKSVVLASDVANLVSTLYGKTGVFNLTDGIHPTFNEIEHYLAKKYRKSVWTIPLWLAKLIAIPGDILPFYPLNTNKLRKITFSLTFSDQKARAELNWNPRSVIANFEN
ncbi:MAG: UDP-galactose-4-epimerase [Bacteroidetes bacterium B1(2017)]|nr:MAG: UDP-galactose-4-epimerase [Bacteroidetes bacterium B1(2017)]